MSALHLRVRPVDLQLGLALQRSFRRVGIVVTLFAIVLAALSLVLDFGTIEAGVRAGAPKELEWYLGFGLMVTLVWLYISILKLLALLPATADHAVDEPARGWKRSAMACSRSPRRSSSWRSRSRPPCTGLEQLVHTWPVDLGYTISFMTIGAAWLGHSSITDRLVRADPMLLRINLLLLFVVAFLPFPTKLIAEALGDRNDERVFVTMYGLTLLMMRLLLTAVDSHARHAQLYSDDEVDEELADRPADDLGCRHRLRGGHPRRARLPDGCSAAVPRPRRAPRRALPAPAEDAVQPGLRHASSRALRPPQISWSRRAARIMGRLPKTRRNMGLPGDVAGRPRSTELRLPTWTARSGPWRPASRTWTRSARSVAISSGSAVSRAGTDG